MDYILYFVFAGIIVIALIVYWVIEFLVARKIKLKAIEELDKIINEEHQEENQEISLNEEQETPIKEPDVPKKTVRKSKKK